jgi:hypothetical protein
MTKPLPPGQKKPKGGPRSNAGRKDSATARKTREAADRINSGELPTALEMQVAGNRALYAHAMRLSARAEQEAELAATRATEAGLIATPDDFLDFDSAAEAWEVFIDANAKVLRFLHPSLSSIEASVNVSRHEDMLDQLDPDGSL